MRISSYLKHGEGIWWKREEGGFRFLDGFSDPDTQPVGPPLDHFRNTTLPDVYHKRSADWDAILHTKVALPSPSIRLYDSDGNYQETSSMSLLPSFSMEGSIPFLSDLQTNLNSEHQHTVYQSSLNTTESVSVQSPNSTLQPTPEQLHNTVSPPGTPQPTSVQTGAALSPPNMLQPTSVQSQATVSPPNMLQLTPELSHNTVSPPGTPQPTSVQTGAALSPSNMLQPTSVQSQATVSPPGMLPVTPVHSQATLSHSSILPTMSNTVPYNDIQNSILRPTILFEHSQSSPKIGSNSERCSSSNQQEPENQSVAEKDIMSVECSIDSLVHDGTETLQTKAAKLIHKVLGQSSDLTRFDQLRLQLKEQLQKGKCLISERDEYRKVIAKLHCHILSLKYRTKRHTKIDGKRVHSQTWGDTG